MLRSMVKTHMSAGIFVVVFIAALLWGPQLIEGTPNSCSALASRAITIKTQGDPPNAQRDDAMIGTIARALGGEVARTYASQKYPNIPTGVTCSGFYWQIMVDPKSLDQMMQARQPSADQLMQEPASGGPVNGD